MIKECKIVLQNRTCIVVDCDGVPIQFPYMECLVDSVYVNIDDNKYSIVSKEDYEKSLMKAIKPEKKEVIKDVVGDVSEETK